MPPGIPTFATTSRPREYRCSARSTRRRSGSPASTGQASIPSPACPSAISRRSTSMRDALVVEAFAVDVGAVQGGDEGEVAAYNAQDFGQRVGPLLAGEHAEVVDDAPVGRLREADRQDQGLAGQAHGLVGADDHEGLGGRRVEERGQARFVGAHARQGLARCAARGGPTGRRRPGSAQGALDRVLDDGVDDGAHLGARGLDRVGAGRGHARRLNPAGAHGRVRGRPRDGDSGVLVAVACQQQGDLVVEAPAGRARRAGPAGRSRVSRVAPPSEAAAQVVDDDQLVAARDDRRQLSQRQAVGAVEDDHVDRAPGGRRAWAPSRGPS